MMHQFVKRLAGLAASGTLLGALAGCGASAPTATTVIHLQMWNDQTGPRLTALNTMVAEFNKTHPTIHITNQFITQSDAMLPKIAAAVSSHSQPNIVFGGTPTWGPLLLKSGATLVLSKSSVPNISEIYPGTLAGEIYKGKLFGLPTGIGDYALFYNKTDFQKAGITAPPKTWAQVIADSVKLTNPAKHRYGIYVPFGKSEWTVWTFEGMLWSAGGHFLNANKTKALFNSPAGDKALQTWVNLLYKYHGAPTTSFATPSNSDGNTAFASNVVAMLIDGAWDLPTFNQAHVNYGVTLFPKIKQYATNEGVGTVFGMKGTPAQNKAVDTFLNWFYAPKNLAQYYYLDTVALPVTSAIDNQPYYHKWIAQDPGLKPFAQEVQYAHSRPTLISYPAISAALGVQIDKALLHQESVKTALNTAAQQANVILKNNHE